MSTKRDHGELRGQRPANLHTRANKGQSENRHLLDQNIFHVSFMEKKSTELVFIDELIFISQCITVSDGESDNLGVNQSM